MRRLAVIGSLSCFFLIGFSIVVSSDKSKPLQTADNGSRKTARDPAAIRKTYDFSELDGSALSAASKKRIIAGYSVKHEADSVGISLGNFVVRGQNGEKEFACRRYQKITMAFSGEGVAVAGEKPVMEVEGHCSVSEDINMIAALWVPTARILGEPVADGEFDFWEQNSVRIRFANVTDQWPTQWALVKVKLSNDNNEEVTIDLSDLQQMLDRPLVLEF
jgi:hypothetical protein